MNANDTIASALRLIRVLAAGETPSADQAEDARAVLNQMLDSWQIERTTIYTQTIQDFTLTPGLQTYTLGTPTAPSAPRSA